MRMPSGRVQWRLVVFVVVLACILVLVSRSVRGPSGEWTTVSRDASREFEKGLDAYHQLYIETAIGHFGRALEMDPDFVAAKLELAANLAMAQPRRSRRLIREVAETDLSQHTERERLLVSYYVALFDGEVEKAMTHLDDYLEEYPEDPYVLNIKATLEWQEGDLVEAERLNLRLLEISPNWVLAYNQLGYGAMARGEFTEAEEYFTSYRYIAPGQPNPHDSLAELYIVVGRWEEAEALLQQARDTWSDFEPALRHLVLVRRLAKDFSGARKAIEEDEGLSETMRETMECDIAMTEFLSEGRERELVEKGLECVEGQGGFRLGPIGSHRVACQIGNWSAAGLLQARVRHMLSRGDAESPVRPGDIRAVLAHMEGVRLALKGKLEDAEAVLIAADRSCTFTTAEVGSFKLLNRLLLTEVMLAQGKEGEAHRLLNQVEGINPRVVARFKQHQLRCLGLDRSRARKSD
ncbi:MAG: tetratricopeptide repeat protein [bacterium]|nr:tetratricopeptide repeat protein [bacterium]